MLFDLTVKISAPGQSPADAMSRLRARVPHWEIELIASAPSENQPAPITGAGAITLPLNMVHGVG